MTSSIVTANDAATAPRHDAWGFWARMGADAPAAWPLAVAAIVEATGHDAGAAGAFLGSRHGRLFADSVEDCRFPDRTLADAVRDATAQWMEWRISPLLNRTYGIPEGLASLVGFVTHYGTVGEEGLIKSRARR